MGVGGRIRRRLLGLLLAGAFFVFKWMGEGEEGRTVGTYAEDYEGDERLEDAAAEAEGVCYGHCLDVRFDACGEELLFSLVVVEMGEGRNVRATAAALLVRFAAD